MYFLQTLTYTDRHKHTHTHTHNWHILYLTHTQSFDTHTDKFLHPPTHPHTHTHKHTQLTHIFSLSVTHTHTQNFHTHAFDRYFVIQIQTFHTHTCFLHTFKHIHKFHTLIPWTHTLTHPPTPIHILFCTGQHTLLNTHTLNFWADKQLHACTHTLIIHTLTCNTQTLFTHSLLSVTHMHASPQPTFYQFTHTQTHTITFDQHY